MERSASPIIGGPEAEARHATIVKCDLVASTRAKRQLDLEAQFKFQQRFQQIIAKTAEKYGAHIDGFEGDGALLVLGFPNPREDAAESAGRVRGGPRWIGGCGWGGGLGGGAHERDKNTECDRCQGIFSGYGRRVPAPLRWLLQRVLRIDVGCRCSAK